MMIKTGDPCVLCSSRFATFQNRPQAASTRAQRLQIVPKAVDDRLVENGKVTSNLDVTEATVSPSFRSTPWEAEGNEDSRRTTARIAFVSESNVCRSVLAEALMERLLETSAVSSHVQVESRATRDYQIGQQPEASTLAIAAEKGIHIAETFQARHFDYAQDTVRFDLILVMDKFTAGDVMREISVYDTINKSGNYTKKVRRLGEFHPELSKAVGSEAQDVDDPLYGNVGGEYELDAVRKAAQIIEKSCIGLLAYLEQLHATTQDRSFPQTLRDDVNNKEELDWLVPPMLQRR